MNKYLSETQVKNLLGHYDKTWTQFLKFMRGQTHTIDSNDKPFYYKGDVSRFIGDDIFYLVDYKGKFNIIYDTFIDDSMYDYEDFITRKEIKNEIEQRKTLSDLYGVPAYIGSDIELNELFGYTHDNYDDSDYAEHMVAEDYQRVGH